MFMSQYVKEDLPPKKKKIKVNKKTIPPKKEVVNDQRADVNWKLLKRKARAEYSYLSLELEHQSEVFEEAKTAFNEHFENRIDKEKETEYFSKDGKTNTPEENKKIPLDMDKAYKKIALKAHPDKKTGNNEIFQDLREAVNAHDIDKILFLASEYDIDLEKDAKINLYKFYTSGIGKLKEKLKYTQSTLAWQWYHGDEAMKEHITESVKALYGK
jgi:hypothetical protein